MKFPKPWHRKGRGWYVTLDGQQVKLSRNRAEAFEKYRELISQPRKPIVSSDSLAAVVDAFLDHIKRNRSLATFEWYRYRLERLCQRFHDYRAIDLMPNEVKRWVESYDFSTTSNRNYLRAAKACLAWAVAEALIRTSPLEHMPVPAGEAKEVFYSRADFDWLVGNFSGDEFADLLTVHWETGCRPQESLRLESRHVDLQKARWVFPRSEAKMKKRVRVIYLSEAALNITQRLTLKYSDGKLFRNRNGVPWTKDSVGSRFYRLQKRTGKRFFALWFETFVGDPRSPEGNRSTDCRYSDGTQ